MLAEASADFDTQSANSDLQEALEFQDFVDEFRTFKHRKHDEIDWKWTETQLDGFLSRLYSRPGCKRYFQTFPNDFAYLAPEIVFEVVEQTDETEILEDLLLVEGTWGQVAIVRKWKLKTANASLARTELYVEYDRQWNNLLRKAPNLYGKLHLNGLCIQWIDAGEELYAQLKPHFSDLSISYHIHRNVPTERQLTPLREFISAQLKSPKLKSLCLKIKDEVKIEEKALLDFCFSAQFEYLDWDCQPLSPEFFVKVFHALKNKRVAPDYETRYVFGFIDRSALKCFIDALELEKSAEKEYRRQDRSLVSDEFCVTVTVTYEKTARVDVRIELEHCESNGKADDVREPPTKKQKFEDVNYEQRYWSLDCGRDCRLQELDEENWTEEDCEFCNGCKLCKPYIRMHCDRCNQIHICNPY